ncbi:MAG TPA: ABC transporter permease [Nocardioides sp.]
MSFNDFGRSTGIVETSNANQYREILGNEFYRQIWLSTLRLTVQAAALTVGIGAVVAYGMWRSGPRLRGILTAVILAPLLVSGVARAYGWIAVAGPNGPWEALTARIGLDDVQIIFNERSVMLGFIHVFMPFAVMLVLVRLDAVKPSVIRAAQDLGGTSLTVIRRVLFPAASPALVSGFLLVFALATASYAIPAVLGGGRVVTIAEVIYTNQAVTFNWPRASALAIALTVLTVIIMAAYQRIAGARSRRQAALVGGAV